MPSKSVSSRPDSLERVARLLESREQLRQLAARLQKAREEDRAAIARELHDELGQTLTAIKLELGRVMAMFAQERLETRTVDRFQSLVGLVEIGLTTVRRIATDLRPPVLDHLGLPSAIRWEAIAFRARTGLRVVVRGVRDETTLTSDQQIGVFRIFQEALTNVVRHAKATAVVVTLTEKPHLFVLRIRDNGRGITKTEQADPRSIGLLGMRERAVLLGGELVIGGQPARGTTVTISVPLGARPRLPKKAGRRRKG
jgi:signal transduction histidine kinase